MPQYRTILKRARKADITGPTLVNALGEGLKGLASGLNAKHQRNMDVQQAELQRKKAEDDAANDAKMQEWRDKQTALEEAKLNAELGKTGVERSQRRDTVARLEQYLTANEDNLSPEEQRAARIVLKTAGTAMSAEALTKEFYKAIFDVEKKKKEGTGGMSESESRLQTNQIIELEQKQIERTVKPIENRMKSDISRIEKKRDAEVKGVKTVFNADEEPDLAATQAKKDEIEARYSQEILDLQEQYDNQINAIWEQFGQRSAPGGFEALQDTVKNNIQRQPTGIPRLDEARSVLDGEVPFDDQQPAAAATPMEDTIGTAMRKPNAATKPAGAFAPNPQSDTVKAQPSVGSEGGMTDEQLLSITKSADVPDELLERWIALHDKGRK